MNQEWSELNKQYKELINKKDTFSMGINILLILRQKLLNQIMVFYDELSKEDFCAMPFINAKGFHNKTIVYSLLHIARIEDIVSHSLIKGEEQIFFREDYQHRINSPIITTGNELEKAEIRDFSEKLFIDELLNYLLDVYHSTNEIIKSLDYCDMKEKISDEKRNNLLKLNVVSEDDKAYWLIDYWCNKDVKGLIQMPLSRHWIMHIEASLRIKERINKMK